MPQEIEEPVETVPQTEDEELEIEELGEGEESPVTNHLMIEARTPEKGLEMALEALKKILFLGYRIIQVIENYKKHLV